MYLGRRGEQGGRKQERVNFSDFYFFAWRDLFHAIWFMLAPLEISSLVWTKKKAKNNFISLESNQENILKSKFQFPSEIISIPFVQSAELMAHLP